MDAYYGHGPRWRDQTPVQRVLTVVVLVGALVVGGVLLLGARSEEPRGVPAREGTGTVLRTAEIERARDEQVAKVGERGGLESVRVDDDGVTFRESIIQDLPSFRLREFDAEAPARIMRAIRRKGGSTEGAFVAMTLEAPDLDEPPVWRVVVNSDDGTEIWTADAVGEVVERA